MELQEQMTTKVRCTSCGKLLTVSLPAHLRQIPSWTFVTRVNCPLCGRLERVEVNRFSPRGAGASAKEAMP